jgi:hypothetical protein
MRGWVCRLQFLLAIAIAVILRSESRGTNDHILLFQIRGSPNLEGPGPHIYISQEGDVPVIPPGTGFPFLRLLRLAGIRWRYSTLPPHGLTIESESELLYDWRFTANQLVLAISSLRLMISNFFSNWTLGVILVVLCNILSEERMCLSFTIAAGPRQRSQSQVWVPQDSWPHFTVSHSRLPQPGQSGPRIYIPQEQGGSVIPPALGSLFVVSYDSQGFQQFVHEYTVACLFVAA